MTTVCVECDKEVSSNLDLCPRCESTLLLTEKLCDDFFATLNLSFTQPSSVPRYPITKISSSEIKIPIWPEELRRILGLDRQWNHAPLNRSEYISTVHAICIDKKVGLWNALCIVVYLYKKEWSAHRYWDDGDAESGRSRGWKLDIFNPIDYMEVAMVGFKVWVNTMKGRGLTRKNLVTQAEGMVNETLKTLS